MFADTTLASRIERAEARLTEASAQALIEGELAAGAFLRQIGRGVGAFLRPGSPMNKVIGIGLQVQFDEAAFAELEELHRARGEPVRVELSTLADGDLARRLTERGYRLLGFENVLGRPLSDEPPVRRGNITVERIGAELLPVWREVILEGFLRPDETGVVVDEYSREVLVQVMDDMLRVDGYDRYLAREGDVSIAAASARLDGKVALLTGAATLAEHRWHGAQGALLAARLADARARGAELAVITTAPGSRSQANAMRQGFSLLYARAVLVRSWS